MDGALAGQLLIATPRLTDYFHRAVVLVLEHADAGAMGVILNRPSPAPLAEAAPALAELAGPGDVIHVGGPVQPSTAVALGRFADPGEASQIVVGDLGVIDPERTEVDLLAARVYAGYAGWAPGQLEAELDEEAWFVEPGEADDPFREDDLWVVALDRKGGEYALLARMPADPSLN